MQSPYHAATTIPSPTTPATIAFYSAKRLKALIINAKTVKVMAKVLLTYDIKKTSDTIHSELKRELIENYGYSALIHSNDGKRYDLPNTCLIKDNTTHHRASSDLVAACRNTGAKWEKYIITEFENATFDNQ
jgi:hypothetical protein